MIPILKSVEVGEYPSKIARIYGWSKQHVFYYLKKLEKAHLVRRDKRSSAVFYELTRQGQKFLGGCEGVVFGSGVYRLHKCQVRYPVVFEGVLPGDFRRVEMQNWTALLGLEHGVKVRRTTRSWIVHVETLYGRSPAELGALARGVADRVAASLCLKYGCRLGEGSFCRGYELAVDDPVSRFLSRFFTVSTPERKMDHSRGELEGEIDHLSRDSAVEYLMMPERIKRMQGQIDVMAGRIKELTDALAGLGNLTGQLNSLLKQSQVSLPPEKGEWRV